MSQTKAQLLGPVLGNVNYDSGTLFVDSANNRVGIGTTVPSNLLTIADNSSIAVGKTWGIDFRDSSKGAAQAFIYAYGRYDTNYNTDLIFGTITTNGSAVERLRITDFGNVGIGTTNPSKKLHVEGSDILVNGVTIGRGDSSTNVVIGTGVGTATGASQSVFIGESAGRVNTSYRNTAVGYQAMYNADISPTNTAIGYQALYTMSGYTYYNTAIGRYALGALTSGTSNIAIGHNAGATVTTGSGNICIAAAGPSTGSSNILIGGSISGATGAENYNVIVGYVSAVGVTNNNIIFGDGQGNERLRINGSGNVGIGTTNPSFGKLDIAGATENQIRINNTNESGHGTVNAKIVAGGSFYQTMNLHAANFVFQTYNGSAIGERIKITSAGDLHSVWNDGRFLGSYYDANYYMGFTFGANNRELYIDNKSNDTRADIVFRTLESAGTPLERLRIRSNGNVGIGTTNPGQKLTITDGNLSLFTTSYTAGEVIHKTITSYARNGVYSNLFNADAEICFGKVNGFDVDWTHGGFISFKTTHNNRDGAPVEYLRITENGLLSLSPQTTSHNFLRTRSTTGGVYGGNGTYNLLNFYHGYWGAAQEVASIRVATTTSAAGSGYGYGDLAFYTGSSGNGDSGSTSTERLRINSSGNVGIGTTNPLHKLDIRGDTQTYGLRLLTDLTNQTESSNIAVSASNLSYKRYGGVQSYVASITCNNTWYTLIPNFNDTSGYMFVTAGDSSSKNVQEYVFMTTSTAYGIAFITQLHNHGSWNTGTFELQLGTSGGNYTLQARATSYYSSSSISGIYIKIISNY